jgi:hypothetical protein
MVAEPGSQTTPNYCTWSTRVRSQVACFWMLLCCASGQDQGREQPRGIRAVFLGLGHDQGMRCWLALDPHSGHILKSNHVVFDETIFPLRNETIPQSLRQTQLDRRFIQDMLEPKNGPEPGLSQPDATTLDDVSPPDAISAPGPVTRSSAKSHSGPPRSILRSYAPGSQWPASGG